MAFFGLINKEKKTEDEEFQPGETDDDGFYLSKTLLETEDEKGVRTEISKCSSGEYHRTATYLDKEGRRCSDLTYCVLSEEEAIEAINQATQQEKWWKW